MSIEPLTPPGTRAPRGGAREKDARGPSGGFGRRALNAAERRLEEELAAHYPQADLAPVRQAWEFAVEAHGDQRRASGEPYVTHPMAVAQSLAELGLDPAAIQAALLHDIPEDTDYSLDDIEERFGREVARLVDGVTKLSKFGARSHEEQQAENIRKMLLAMALDLRVVLIKLADRLHNMRTIHHLPRAKQVRIAEETLSIYAPLAHRLGMQQFKWQLEDLAFATLH
ncbi:MAG: HD domain-containing protein, partial [Chloroflexota bacterium]|nr:HD domain-containing protein [Chloroflexota bacterium]